MALAPANVLMSDPASEWLKVGAPLVLQQDLVSSQFISPVMVNEETAAPDAGAQDILRLKLEDRQGKIHITATVVDIKTQKTTGTEEADAASLGMLIPALDKLAKSLEPSAGEFSTKNVDALKLLTAAGSEQHPQERFGLLKKAVAADPNFAMAYFVALEMLASSGPDAYKGLITEAKAHMASFPPYERARFQLLQMQLEGAPLNQRTAAAESLLKVAPNDLDALSLIGNIRFLNGDANGGAEALGKAAQLNPGNVNLKAQLAEGLVQSRRFADAEKILAKFDKTPAAMSELSQTILLEGDTKRANESAEKFLAAVPNPDFQALLRATWSEISGDHAKAVTQAQEAKFSKPEYSGMALNQAAVWEMLNKNMAGARKMAALGAQSDKRATPTTMVSTLLISGDESAEEWRKKVEASPINPALKGTILAYGFFLNGHYPEAAAEWKKAYEVTQGADLRSRAMYAASLDRAGKKDEAQKIKVQPFLIRDFADVYGVVPFNEMRRLLGLVH